MLLELFYHIKPFIPRNAQIFMRRIRARRIFRQCNGQITMSGDQKGDIFPWPEDYEAAAIITHDVELAPGQSNIWSLIKMEDKYNIKSCWNFVVDRYPVNEKLIDSLRENGHEIGVHGVKHDGKLFNSRHIFNQRLKIMESVASRWKAVGFRSPALLYDIEMLKDLPFLWDSSIPAWDPFQPIPGGCKCYYPFLLNNHCVELPVTLWQDFTLLEELQVEPNIIWFSQIDAILSMGGLINIIIHPDYFTSPQRLHIYDQFLEYIVSKKNIWLSTPSAVAKWTLSLTSEKGEE